MITEKDLQEAIAECQGVRSPTASTAIKLAAFLTIQREMFGPSYSNAEPPEPIIMNSGVDTVGDYGDSEFLQAVRGKDPATVWRAMDELMDTMKIINARVYDSVLRKIR